MPRSTGDCFGHRDVREIARVADHRGPVTAANLNVATGAGDHFAGIGGVLAADHRDRRQSSVDLTQSAIPRCGRAGDDHLLGAHRDRMGGPLQQCLHHRGGSEVGDVERGARSFVIAHRLAHNRVRQAGDHPGLRVGPAGQQGHLEIHRVVTGSTDHRLAGGDPGGGQAGGGL